MNFDFEQITSRKNPKIIKACSLEDKKRRDREGLFAMEGEKLILEALTENIRITELYFTEKAMNNRSDILEKAYDKGAKLHLVTAEVYEKLTYEKASQGFFAVAEKFDIPYLSEKTDTSCGMIVLESVRDPSNVGAILRSCAALGCPDILLTDDCADVFGYKTLRAAMGAIFKTRLCRTRDIAESISQLQKSGKVYAAALTDSAKSIADITFDVGDSIIIGNEGHGVSDKVLDNCTGSIIIPMQCGSESLNASVAAAILIWEKAKKTGDIYSRK